jgi:hypothetical protein
MSPLTFFIKKPVPVITSISPTSAQTGQFVVITGYNLSATTSVTFGGVPAQSFTVNSNTQITAVVSTGANGSVVVITPNGNASFSGFTFNQSGVLPFPGDPTNDGLLFPIGAQQTRTGGGYDNGYVTLTPAFPVTIYDQTFSTIHVNTNGTISQNIFTQYSNTPLDGTPFPNPGYYIAGLWQDIGSNIHYYQETGVESITWIGQTIYNLDVPSIFQVVFFDSGNPYGADPGSFAIAWGENLDFAGATVGVRKNDSGATYLSPNTLIPGIGANGIAVGYPPEIGLNGNILYEPDGLGSYTIRFVQPPQVWIAPPILQVITASADNGTSDNTTLILWKNSTLTLTGNGFNNPVTDVRIGGISYPFTIVDNNTLEVNINAIPLPTANFDEIVVEDANASIVNFEAFPVFAAYIEENATQYNFDRHETFVQGFKLSSPPTANVNLTLRVLDGVFQYTDFPNGYTVEQNAVTLTFTPGNWNTFQNITFNTNYVSFLHQFPMEGSVQSSDANYNYEQVTDGTLITPFRKYFSVSISNSSLGGYSFSFGFGFSINQNQTLTESFTKTEELTLNRFVNTPPEITTTLPATSPDGNSNSVPFNITATNPPSSFYICSAEASSPDSQTNKSRVVFGIGVSGGSNLPVITGVYPAKAAVGGRVCIFGLNIFINPSVTVNGFNCSLAPQNNADVNILVAQLPSNIPVGTGTLVLTTSNGSTSIPYEVFYF